MPGSTLHLAGRKSGERRGVGGRGIGRGMDGNNRLD